MTQEITHRATDALHSTPFEIVTPLSSRTLFWRARYLRKSSSLYHLPFLFWLVDVVRPRRFVDMGVGEGAAYFAVCQALDKLDVDARCYGYSFAESESNPEAQSDEDLASYNAAQYSEFSRLEGPFGASAQGMKEAAGTFDDKSIDLLHVNLDIDQDMIASLNNDWTRKLSDRSVVLFSAVRSRFATGPARDFLDGIIARYPSATLEAGDGMVAVLFGGNRDERLLKFSELKLGMSGFSEVQQVFARLGASSYFEWAATADRARAAQAEKNEKQTEEALRSEQAEAQRQKEEIDQLRQAYDERGRHAFSFQAQVFDLQTLQKEQAAEQLDSQAKLAGLMAELEGLKFEFSQGQEALIKAEQDKGLLLKERADVDGALRALLTQLGYEAVPQDAQGWVDIVAVQKDALMPPLVEELQRAADQAASSASAEDLKLLTNRLQEDRKEIERARLAVKDAEAETEGLRELLAAWEARAKDAERYNAELLQSTSWKLMAPARAVLGGFRRGSPGEPSS